MGFDPISIGIGSALFGGGTTAAAGSGVAALADTIAVGSTIASTAGAYMGAQAQNKAARYNAQAAELEAESAQKVGAEKEQQVMEQTAQTVGAQRAIYGAAGLESNMGTAAQVQAQTEQQGKYNQSIVEQNTAQRVAALQQQKAGYQSSMVNPLLPTANAALTGFANMTSSAATRKYQKTMLDNQMGSGKSLNWDWMNSPTEF